MTTNNAFDVTPFPPDYLRSLLLNPALRAEVQIAVADALYAASGSTPFENHLDLQPHLAAAKARVEATRTEQKGGEARELAEELARQDSSKGLSR